MSPESLKDYYKTLNITANLLGNAVAAARFTQSLEWQQLGKPVNHDDWGMSAFAVNAYYSTSENEIVFPAGIMQFPLYDVELPAYVSYGGFGSVVGHEMSHGYDNVSDPLGFYAYHDLWLTG